MEIITHPDKRLFTVSEPIAEINEAIIILAEKMIDKMYLVKALGLAAVQVGEPIRMFVCDVDGDPLIAINPELKLKGSIVENEEGCLSLPYLFAEVPRDSMVSLYYHDLDNAPQVMAGTDRLAFVFQHEMDHLNGVLYWSHLSHLKRSILRKKYLRLRRMS
jgi:peptide deformylase